jgi:hypothetical protein
MVPITGGHKQSVAVFKDHFITFGQFNSRKIFIIKPLRVIGIIGQTEYFQGFR